MKLVQVIGLSVCAFGLAACAPVEDEDNGDSTTAQQYFDANLATGMGTCAQCHVAGGIAEGDGSTLVLTGTASTDFANLKTYHDASSENATALLNKPTTANDGSTYAHGGGIQFTGDQVAVWQTFVGKL